MGGLRVTVHVYGPRSKKSWIFCKLWAAQMLNIWVWCLDDSLCSLISCILLWMRMRKRNSPTWWIIIVLLLYWYWKPFSFPFSRDGSKRRTSKCKTQDKWKAQTGCTATVAVAPKQRVKYDDVPFCDLRNMNMTEHCSKLQRPPNKDFMLSSKDETWSCSVTNEMGFCLWGIIALWLELYTAKLNLTLYC